MLDQSGFREIVRLTATRGAGPLLAGLFLAFSALALLASIFAGPLWWLPASFAAVSGVFAIFIVVWALIRQPELLRSERHEIAQRAIDLIGGDNLTPETIDGIVRVLSEEPSKKSGKRGSLLQ